VQALKALAAMIFHAHATRVLAGVTAAVLAFGAATPAHAEPAPNWNGWFRITFHTDQKSGSSIAA
jgi:hypothetical protein